MENKLNIAELLKDCPKGMELDCTMFENLYFDYILKPEDLILCYTEYDNIRTSVTFNRYGAYSGIRQAKCVIFPKGKDTWEGFQRPAKDGDVVVCEEQKMITQMFVVQSEHKEGRGKCYFGYDFENEDFFKENIWEWDRLATEEERQKLFDAIRAKGYRWNAETKTLEKLVNPNFKVGNKIIRKGRKGIDYPIEVLAIENGMYKMPAMSMPIDSQDEWELVSDKFDITTLKPFESRVLVRNADGYLWKPAIYGFSHSKMCYVVGGLHWVQCIPYEENKHLIGTTDDCSDFYKTWENDY